MKQFMLVHGEGYIKPECNKALFQVYPEAFFLNESEWPLDIIAKIPELKVGGSLCLEDVYVGDIVHCNVCSIVRVA